MTDLRLMVETVMDPDNNITENYETENNRRLNVTIATVKRVIWMHIIIVNCRFDLLRNNCKTR